MLAKGMIFCVTKLSPETKLVRVCYRKCDFPSPTTKLHESITNVTSYNNILKDSSGIERPTCNWFLNFCSLFLSVSNALTIRVLHNDYCYF